MDNLMAAMSALGEKISLLEMDLTVKKIVIERKDCEIAELKKRISELEGEKNENISSL